MTSVLVSSVSLAVMLGSLISVVRSLSHIHGALFTLSIRVVSVVVSTESPVIW